MEKLNTKQKQLLEFVKIQHGEQVRKYTGEPYWNHVLSVALIIILHESKGVEIALCHDLFEDTKCDFSKLHKELVSIGYEHKEAYAICINVNELTDKYTHEDYPYHNRAKRKSMEAERLWSISPLAQSVKYADLIDNTSSIVEHDESFAKIYISEKEDILRGMSKGNSNLHTMCMSSLIKSKDKLSQMIHDEFDELSYTHHVDVLTTSPLKKLFLGLYYKG